MNRRVFNAVLLLYPRRVRRTHGPELLVLVDDLVVRDGRSRIGLITRLAIDGLVQRAVSTATAWTVAAVLATTSFAGLVASNFAAASPFHRAGQAAHVVRHVPRGAGPVSRHRHRRRQLRLQ